MLMKICLKYLCLVLLDLNFAPQFAVQGVQEKEIVSQQQENPNFLTYGTLSLVCVCV